MAFYSYGNVEPSSSRRLRTTLDTKNGYLMPQTLGDIPQPSMPIDLGATAARITYGDQQRGFEPPKIAAFVPAHVAFDKKVLLFTAYMKTTVNESADETFRVRYFKVYYYLEDDTISMTEPDVENSGIQQGAFLKRQRLPRNAGGVTYHWRDLNVGMNMTVYGKVMRITDCNAWTKEYLTAEGIKVNPAEGAPEDPYSLSRLPTDKLSHTHTTKSDFDKFKQFLEYDRKVLRYYACWDDRHNMFGELRSFVICYYLADDTVEVREVYEDNDGHDPFPVLLGRKRVPVNHKTVPMSFPTCTMETTEHEEGEHLNPTHFAIGKTVHILGRDLLIYSMDGFTKSFYQRNFGAGGADLEPINVKLPPALMPEAELAPHNGIGSAEDALRSCMAIAPKAPLGQKSLPKLLKYENSLLRYNARLDTTVPQDINRTFLISYRLRDDHVSIYVPKTMQNNSGIVQGKFLEDTRLQRPGSHPDMPEYLAPGDFYVGARIEVYGRTFIIEEADGFVKGFMADNAKMWDGEIIANMEAYFASKGI